MQLVPKNHYAVQNCWIKTIELIIGQIGLGTEHLKAKLVWY